MGQWDGVAVRIEEAGCLVERAGRGGLARIGAFLAGFRFDPPKAHCVTARSGETQRDVRALADARLAPARAAAMVSRTRK